MRTHVHSVLIKNWSASCCVSLLCWGIHYLCHALLCRADTNTQLSMETNRCSTGRQRDGAILKKQETERKRGETQETFLEWQRNRESTVGKCWNIRRNQINQPRVRVFNMWDCQCDVSLSHFLQTSTFTYGYGHRSASSHRLLAESIQRPHLSHRFGPVDHLFFSFIGVCADGMSSRNEIPVEWAAPSLPSVRVSELRGRCLKFSPAPCNLPSVPENLVQSRVEMKTQREAIREPTKWRRRSVRVLSVLFSLCPSLFALMTSLCDQRTPPSPGAHFLWHFIFF